MDAKFCRLMISGLIAFYLLAETASAALLSPADRLTIQQRQRELLEQHQQQRHELQRSLSPLIKSAAPPLAPATGPCFKLTTITLHGANHLPDADKQRLLKPFQQQCSGIAQIQTLVQQVSNWYLSRGFITSRAFVNEQDLSQGELSVMVLEGRLEDILLEHQHAAMLKMAFPALKGNILNLRDIEQGMEQINRLRQRPVEIEILPGSKAGYSLVNLTATPQFPLDLGLGFDNSGQKSTGVGQLNASVTGNNLLGLADQWFVFGATSSDFASDHYARSLQSGFSLPYGYWLLNYSYAWSDYLSAIENNGFNWLSSGDQQTHRLALDRVIYRSGEIKSGVSLGVTHRLNRNYLNDVLLESSSRKLSTVTLGLNHSQKLWHGFATLNPVWTRGVPWFGAENDQGKTADAPQAEFNKFSLAGSYYLPLTQYWTYVGSFYGQWTADRLYGSERLTIGGDASVRGFKEQYLSGDIGGYWRNEIDRTLFTLPLTGSVSALAAIDGGWLRHDRQDAWASGTLWGAAIGVNSRSRYYSSQFTLGWPLASPHWLEPDRLSIGYRINLVW